MTFTRNHRGWSIYNKIRSDQTNFSLMLTKSKASIMENTSDEILWNTS